jgi:hypothetical protein
MSGAFAIPEGVSLLVLVGIAQPGDLLYIPILVPASLLVWFLFRAREVPSRAKRVTSFIVAGALALMLVIVTWFQLENKPNTPGGLLTSIQPTLHLEFPTIRKLDAGHLSV